MQGDVDEDDDNISEINLNSADGVLERDLKSPGLFVWLLTFSAGISGLLFGCRFSITIRLPHVLMIRQMILA